MKKALIAILLTTLLAGCYSKRLLEEEPSEKAGSRVTAWHIFQNSKAAEIQGKLVYFISRSKESLKAGFTEPLAIGETAWYKFPDDEPNWIIYYAVFDCVGVPNNIRAFGVIEESIMNEWKAFSKEVHEKYGEEASFSYYTKPGATDRFSMVFTIRKKKG